MENKIRKLENPARLRELAPEATLRRIGVGPGHVLVDIGAGSGIFTFPAALLTGSRVYAAEADGGMLEWLAQKAAAEHIDFVTPVRADGLCYPIDDASADWALMVTVLHEIPDKPALIREIRRMLKPSGRAAVIELQKRATPMGPPEARRLSGDEVRLLFEAEGFAQVDAFGLGENFYCRVFRKE